MSCLPNQNATRCDDADEMADLADFEARVQTLLPPLYQACFDAVRTKSMGSAALKYSADARVAWDQIWTHYCDLALAGGPPHRGTLLEAPTPDEVDSEPAGYQLVSEEIVRGLHLTTGLDAVQGSEKGWITVRCHSEGMAAWLLRAVMAENVFVRRSGDALLAPAGPTFRIAKEVKNVIVAFAKTFHYWQSHLTDEQRTNAAALAAEDADLLQPSCRAEVLAHAPRFRDVAECLEQSLAQATGLPVVRDKAGGWVGLRFPDEKTAAWFVRSAIALNILARREENVLWLPVPSQQLTPGQPFEIVQRLTRLQGLWTIHDGKSPS